MEQVFEKLKYEKNFMSLQKLDSKEKERRAQLVIDSSDGVLPLSEAFYIHSIKYSVERCLESFGRYAKLRDAGGGPEELVSMLQEAVGHAAALSRYFWPSPVGKKGESNQRTLKIRRGEKLRRNFDLDDISPLNNRDLRNAWEHFDERLDTYLLEHSTGLFFPSCIVDSHQLADDPAGHIFKLLDPVAECLVLMGQKHFYSPIFEEVNRISILVNDMDNNGSRLKST